MAERHRIVLDGPADVAGWRRAARNLALAGVAPEDVDWLDAPELSLWDGEAAPVQASPGFSVPRGFLDLADQALLHRDPERFALMYRLLWRILPDRRLLERESDADIVRANVWQRNVARDIHKMHAFLRFRAVEDEGQERFVAWYEPDHHIVEAAAPFFMRRFAAMRWTILSPEATADWDGDVLRFGPGAARDRAPTADELEDLWRGYYASTFNPARLNPRMMKREMPVRFWRNLPEAALIGSLMDDAAGRTREMVARHVDAGAGEGRANRGHASPSDHTPDIPVGADIETLRVHAAGCRSCPLWRPATQTVFGAGPDNARVVLVGEQPGDQEDIQGHPFVGPAGQLLDRALAEAGIDRSRLYVTNAVKHFKFVPRGKRRIHQKPGGVELRACAPWLEAELAAIDPSHVVALGATAVQAVLGKALPIGKNRGHWQKLDGPLAGGGRHVLITMHPSALLRLPDEAAKAEGYRQFVADLRAIFPYQ